MDIINFDKMGCKTSLAEVYLDEVGCDHPLEVCTHEPFDGTHEINCGVFFKEAFKFDFNCRVFQEVNKIIDVNTKCERRRGRGLQRVQWINFVTAEQAWVISILLQANLVQDFAYLVIPVFGAAPETVKSAFE